MKIITVHGIRRQNRWYEYLQNIDTVKENNIEILNFEYGFFSFWKFLLKSERNKIINLFCEYYNDKIKNPKSNPPSLIAHSFGTFVVFKAMKKYDIIKFDKIIFCGSILNSKLDFREVIKSNQFNTLKNDHGKLEWFLRYTRLLIGKDCGKAGKVGFLDIPKDEPNKIINIDSYKGHSDYFLPLNMEKNWLDFLTSDIEKHEYNSEILKKIIIDRIYDNINLTAENLEVNSISYFARIDKKGNYFAKYVKKGINNNSRIIDTVNFATTADGIGDAENMSFITYDSENRKLNSDIISDYNNKKSFKIYLNSPLNSKEIFELKHYFCWYNTMNLKFGDTDHWSFPNIKNISISLNFPFELKRPKIFIIKNKKVVNELRPSQVTENDNTFTYNLKYDNIENNDGAVFYYEGINNKKIFTYKKNKEYEILIENNKETFIVDTASENEINKIYDIELRIENSNAASEETLKNRINMFNDGFMVIKHKKNGDIVGYIESFLWNEKKFESFEEISNFPLNFNVNGETLYVIFLAIDSPYRNLGLGEILLKEVEILAKKYNAKKIQLVAKDQLMDYYSKFGYKEINELPNFLKGKNYKSVLMEKRVKSYA